MENKTLATVNGNEITQQNVDNMLQRMGPQRAIQFQSPEGQKRILDELINQELIYVDAINESLDKQEDFLKELELLKVDFLKQFAINKLLGKINVDECEVEKYYAENKEMFTKPISVKASHILIDDEVTASKILKEINGGLSFEEAASKYSKCPSEETGGDLGYFTPGKMVPEFENAAFGMNIGEISKPVKTQFGYHIIKLTDKKEAEASSLDEVKSELTSQLASMKQNDTYISKCNELKNKYSVVVK